MNSNGRLIAISISGPQTSFVAITGHRTLMGFNGASYSRLYTIGLSWQYSGVRLECTEGTVGNFDRQYFNNNTGKYYYVAWIQGD